MNKKTLFALGMAVLLSCAPSMAADYYCEVMTLTGEAWAISPDGSKKPLQQGLLLKAGDTVEVSAEGQVDLAFDREWNNITRLWPSTRVRIRSIYPTGLGLDRGDLFSKLDKLPAGSTFEIQTPTAVAAVRGTEFLTSVSEKGQTSVVSFEHAVEVFNLDADGNLGDRVMVQEAQKTVVEAMGAPPAPPVPAPKEDMERVSAMSTQIQAQVQEMTTEGRFAQVQSAGSVEAVMKMAEILKSTAPSEDAPRTDDKRPASPPDGGGPGGPGGSTAAAAATDSTLSPDQRQMMKDNFVKLGGVEADFKFAEQQMVSSGMTMDGAAMEKFNATTATFLSRPESFTRDPYMATASTAVMEPTYMPAPTTTGTFDPARLESTYQPPAMTTIEKQMDQVTNQIQTTTTATSTFTSSCVSGTDCTYLQPKYRSDGTLCTSSNPC